MRPSFLRHSSNIEILISGSENVQGIQALLQLSLPLKRSLGHDPRKKTTAQFANSVVMRKRSTRFQDFIARHVFELEIHFLWIGDSFVIEPEIEINAHTGGINLRDSRAHERFAGQFSPAVLFEHAFFYI